MTMRIALCFCLLAALVGAQQPNTLPATMTVNGVTGPPYPIQGLSVQGGNTATIDITGNANQPFILAHAGGFSLPGLNVLGGLLDLELGSLEVILDGFNVAPWLASTDASGSWSNSYNVPNNIPQQIRSYQAAVADAASSTGVSLTAATGVGFVPGPTIINLNMGDDTTSLVNLSPYGVTLDFYGQSWTSMNVNSNGSVTFGGGDTDFTATAGEMNGGLPRVSGLWTDLAPNGGGTVRVIVDQVSLPGVDQVKVEFNQVAEFGGTGVTHTFTQTMFGSGVGDITISYDPFTGQPSFDTVCGITPGGNQSPAPGNASRDLSMLQAQGGVTNAQPLEGFFEFFVGVTSTTPGTNFFDLVSATLTWMPVGSTSLTDTYLFL